MFGLKNKNVIVNVTDTKATMVASSTLFKQHAAAAGVPEHGWLTCIAHILNLITNEAYDRDGPSMRKARALVHSFVASSQLNDLLKSLQTNLPPGKKPVTVIPDILTRWWSTYSMIERLLRLRTYIATIQDAHKRITPT